MFLNIARLFAGLLLLLTSFALVQLSEAVGSPSRPANCQQATQIVRHYFAALNQYLDSGELAEMRTIASAQGFAVLPEAGAYGEESALATYLLALRSSNPAMRFSIEDHECSGEIAIVRVNRSDAASGHADSNDLAGVPSTEFFRVRDGRIIQHWTSAPPATLFHSLTSEDLTIRVDRPGRLAMADLAVWPNPANYVAVPGPGVIVLTSGELELLGNGLTEVIDIESGSRRTTVPGVAVKVATGEAIFIPRRHAVIRNVSANSTSARIVAVASGAPEITEAGMDRAYERDETGAFSQKLLEGTDTVLGGAGIVIHPLTISEDRVESGSWRLVLSWALIAPGGSYRVPDGEGFAETVTLAGSVTTSEEGNGPNSETVLSNDGARPALVLVATLGSTKGEHHGIAATTGDQRSS